MSLVSSLQNILTPYQATIEQHLADYIATQLPAGRLCEACSYAVGSQGKRLRPAIVLMVAEALGRACPVIPAALAVEFFHTASLVADDLPCMDNDDERRGKPSLHRAFDEATALLASYALIAEGYACLTHNIRQLQQSEAPHAAEALTIGMLAWENSTHNTGARGATGGQYYDLFAQELSDNRWQTILEQKTVSLFELAFVLGWLFGGGEAHNLPLVKACAYHFGMAFQIADDIADQAQDSSHLANTAVQYGPQKAYQLLQVEINQYTQTLEKLGLHHSPLKQFSHLLQALAP